jgi:hypothetical protein
MYNERERKDFRSVEKYPPQEVNKDETSFWPGDELSVRGMANRVKHAFFQLTSVICGRKLMFWKEYHQEFEIKLCQRAL